MDLPLTTAQRQLELISKLTATISAVYCITWILEKSLLSDSFVVIED